MISITRQFEISGAHHLPLHEGKCHFPHGHNYLIEVTVSGPLQASGPATGMVMDFSDLNACVNKLLGGLDHKDLNDILDTPTAENIAQFIWDELSLELPLTKVKVYETRDSFVEVYSATDS